MGRTRSLDLLRSDWSERGGWICSFAVVAKCMESPLGCSRLEGGFSSPSPLASPLAGLLSVGWVLLASVTSGLRFPALAWQPADRLRLRGRPQIYGESARRYPTCRPFGPYHSPPASNWGDWWVVLGLDPLRSDWSEIGGWIRSFAGPPNVGCVRSASTDCNRPSAPNPRVPVGLTWWRVG